MKIARVDLMHLEPKVMRRGLLGFVALGALVLVGCVKNDGGHDAQEQAVVEVAPAHSYPDFVEAQYFEELTADVFKRQDRETYDELRRGIRRAGYSCDTLSGVRPAIIGGGVVVICNNLNYEYVLEDKGGRLSVRLKD